MKILVSACLLGENVKYSGGNNRHEELVRLLKGHTVVPVCPEVMGGLPIPRRPAEIVDGIVRTADGTSVDAEYRKGAQLALAAALNEAVDFAVLQPRSPSCGCGLIYDGTFSKKLVSGYGITAELLLQNGIRVMDADEAVEELAEITKKCQESLRDK